MTSNLPAEFFAFLGLLMSASVSYAGQIVVDAPRNNTNLSAPAPHQSDYSSALPASAVIIDDVGDFSFFPQHGDDSLPESNAGNLRKKAREQQSESDVLPSDNGRNVIILSPEQAASEGASDNLSKARAYMKNNSSERVSELPVVICGGTSNITGSIGDDSQSGNIITVLVKGKPVRVRCR